MSAIPQDDSEANAQLQAALGANARYQDQIYFLTEMGGLLGQLELPLLLVKILELTTDFVGADVGAIVLAEPGGGWQTAVNWGIPHAAVLDLRRLDGTSILDLALQTGEPQAFRGAELRPVLDGAYHVENAILQPLRTEGRVLGCVVLVLPDATDAPRAERLDALTPAVGLAAIAVENAQLVRMKLERQREQQQLKIAQQIQRCLLPAEEPQVPGLQLATAFVPATEIGGDYYDCVELADGSVGLVVADVAGKGVPAGLVMTAVRAMFRTAWQTIHWPGRLLQQVNDQLCRERLNGYFVTAICLRVDVTTGSLTVSKAGHDPMLLLQDGRVERGGEGLRHLPLGIHAGTVYQEATYDLRPGDAFVLYTDGITEAMNEFRHLFGPQRLHDIVGRCTGMEARTLVREITRAVDEHVGGSPRHDDITLLVGRLLAAPVPAAHAVPAVAGMD